MKELVCTIELRPLISYSYLVQKTYYHDHVIAPSPWTTSFFDPLQPQVLLLVTLRFHSKVKQIHHERIEVFKIELRPLTSFCYLEQKTYYHDHVTSPSPQTTSFFDPLQPQVLLLVTLRFHSKVLDLLYVLYAATEAITKFLTCILILITLSVYKGKHLQISQKIQHIAHQKTFKTQLGFFLLYLE